MHGWPQDLLEVYALFVRAYAVIDHRPIGTKVSGEGIAEVGMQSLDLWAKQQFAKSFAALGSFSPTGKNASKISGCTAGYKHRSLLYYPNDAKTCMLKLYPLVKQN